MDKLFLKLKLLDPVIITEKKGSNLLTYTKEYITCSTIYGVFANLLVKNKISLDHLNNIYFANAYITEKNDKDKYFFTIPKPLSIQEKKGVSNKKQDIDVTYDILVEPVKDEITKHSSRYVYLNNSGENSSLYNFETETRINFHHSNLENKKDIFNYAALSPNQEFITQVTITNNDTLNEFKKLVEKNPIIRIGRSKNTEYGRAEIEILDQNDVVDIKAFNEDDVDDVIICTFISEGIFYNQNGMSSVDKDTIEKYLNGAKIKNMFCRAENIVTSVAVWNMKKPSEVAVKAGTCLLLDKLPENYKELESIGIGERLNEGFGKVKFLIQGRDKYVISNPVMQKFQVSDFPELYKRMFYNYLDQELKVKILAQAMDNAQLFKPTENNIGTSLLSRLVNILLGSNKNIENFLVNIKDQVKGRSKDKIENFYNSKNETISEHVENFCQKGFDKFIEENLNEIIKVKDKIKTLGDEYLEEIKKDKEKIENLKYEYVYNFLINMRKQIKLNKKKNGEENEE